MTALILDGRLENQKHIDAVAKPLGEMLAARGWEVDAVLLHRANVKSCTGCFRCWHTTPGVCSGVGGDDGEELMKKTIASEMVVFLTPLTFGGYSSELKKTIERCLGLLQPAAHLVNGETHHKKRYDRYPSVLSLAVADRPDKNEIELFKRLGERHSRNFYPPSHTSEVVAIAEGDIETKLESVLARIGV